MDWFYAVFDTLLFVAACVAGYILYKRVKSNIRTWHRRRHEKLYDLDEKEWDKIEGRGDSERKH